MEITEGKIYIDEIDIDEIGVDALRQELAMIPQDPILFEGTLRFNLDPWYQYNDAVLWEKLKLVQLEEFVAFKGGLDLQVSESGSNFSVGQRQLICLARFELN